MTKKKEKIFGAQYQRHLSYLKMLQRLADGDMSVMEDAKKMLKGVCEGCGVEFMKNDMRQRFHNDKCRNAHSMRKYNAKKKAQQFTGDEQVFANVTDCGLKRLVTLAAALQKHEKRLTDILVEITELRGDIAVLIGHLGGPEFDKCHAAETSK